MKMLENATKKEVDPITIFLKRIRKDYQGKVFIQLTLSGEKELCIQKTKNKIKSLVSILQFYSAVAFAPLIRCNIGAMGQIFVPEDHLFVESAEDMHEMHKSIPGQSGRMEYLDAEALRMHKKAGFFVVLGILNKKRKTRMEELILKCISIFSKGIIAPGMQEKLIFYLVALETLLLKDHNESIGRNVGLRLAHMIESDHKKKKKIVDLIPKAYEYRGKFIHHGIDEIDTKVLEEVQFHIWSAIYHAIINAVNYKSKEDLISYLENQILN